MPNPHCRSRPMPANMKIPGTARDGRERARQAPEMRSMQTPDMEAPLEQWPTTRSEPYGPTRASKRPMPISTLIGKIREMKFAASRRLPTSASTIPTCTSRPRPTESYLSLPNGSRTRGKKLHVALFLVVDFGEIHLDRRPVSPRDDVSVIGPKPAWNAGSI